ncbi:MAG: type VI secretion system baseplate subunit TssE [Pseudomonadota bacterium]
MAEAAYSEQLQPSLLDRLTDNLYGIEAERERLQRRVAKLLSEEDLAQFEALIAEQQRSIQPFDRRTLQQFSGLDEADYEPVASLVEIEKQRYFEMRQNYVISMSRLRECVLRDLTALFNTDNFDSVTSLDNYPNVRASVINYGVPPLAGTTVSNVDSEALARRIRDAIRNFEPRIRRETVKVRIMLDQERMSHNTLSLEIEGELWGDPLPLKLLLRTLIDLESGTAIVEEAA